jgi:hypothetical protein
LESAEEPNHGSHHRQRQRRGIFELGLGAKREHGVGWRDRVLLVRSVNIGSNLRHERRHRSECSNLEGRKSETFKGQESRPSTHLVPDFELRDIFTDAFHVSGDIVPLDSFPYAPESRGKRVVNTNLVSLTRNTSKGSNRVPTNQNAIFQSLGFEQTATFLIKTSPLDGFGG